MANCPQCGGKLHTEQHNTYTALYCVEMPAHYSEHRRKPGAPYLWGAEFHISEEPAQLTLEGVA